MTDFANEGGHFYKYDGTPFYTMIGKNGKERPVTVTDAKGIAGPSVTLVQKVERTPYFLDKWIKDQLVDAALTLPEIPNESMDDRKARIYADADAQRQQAQELGTAIHGAIENALKGEMFNKNYARHVEGVVDWITRNGLIQVETERSFYSDIHPMDTLTPNFDYSFRGINLYVSTEEPGLVFSHEWHEEELDAAFRKFQILHALYCLNNRYDFTGYGGKTDLIARDKHGIKVIVDFKCKAFRSNKSSSDLAYNEHLVQIAAYGRGI